MEELAAANIVSQAKRAAVGDTYIAVSHQVEQTLRNATVRQGTEWIILSGVDIKRLSRAEIDKAEAALRTLFTRLQELSKTINWDSSQKTTVVACPQLQEWITATGLQTLPRAAVQTAAPYPPSDANFERKPTVPPWRSKWLLTIGAFAVFAIALVLLGKGRSEKGGAEPDPNGSSKSVALQELANDWGCTDEELAASLLCAANWDRRYEADSAPTAALIADGEVLAMLDKIKSTNSPSRYFASPALERESGMDRLVAAYGVRTASDAQDLRQWLYEAWEKFSALKQAATDAGMRVRDNGEGKAPWRFIVKVSKLQVDVGTGDGFREPATPLFDRQDVMIYRALDRIRQAMMDTGVAQDLIADTSSADDLPKFLDALQQPAVTIQNVIEPSRHAMMDSPHTLSRDVGDVRDAYRALEAFLLHLSQRGSGAS